MNKKQNGGDGYSVNVNKSIGGLPGVIKYSNNYKPVFFGDLLDQTGGGDCGCGSTPVKESSIYDIIQQNLDVQTGGKKGKNITQFHAIREVSYLLEPLEINSLTSLINKTFLNILSIGKPNKSKQMGGYTQELENILVPLGKNNLSVLGSLLLLHHFAKESPSKSSIQKGGNIFLNSISDILNPLGINKLGIPVILDILQNGFSNKKQIGGNALKELITPIGKNSFIASGLLVTLEKLFTNKINNIKKNGPNKDLKGNTFNKYYEKLFNMIAPITFNAFATESTLKKIIDIQKNK
jgi:hypothetical protein